MHLEARNVTGGYARAAPVLHDVSLDVGRSEIVVLIGRNGVGKSTLLRALMGLLPTAAGDVLLNGEGLSHLSTYARARRGLAYVPQGRDLFGKSTVEQNLRYGHLLAGRSMRESLPAEVFEWFPWLKARAKQLAGTLSGGEQQMVAIARVLVGDPKVLLLDEPTEGLAPIIVEQLAQVIRDIATAREMGILLVEQNVEFALELATRGYVMEKGQIVVDGSTEQLGSKEVLSQYLLV